MEDYNNAKAGRSLAESRCIKTSRSRHRKRRQGVGKAIYRLPNTKYITPQKNKNIPTQVADPDTGRVWAGLGEEGVSLGA